MEKGDDQIDNSKLVMKSSFFGNIAGGSIAAPVGNIADALNKSMTKTSEKLDSTNRTKDQAERDSKNETLKKLFGVSSLFKRPKKSE